jgi:hypothetical protein
MMATATARRSPLLDATPRDPRYGMLLARRHLPGCRDLPAKRQLAMLALKLLRQADPGRLEVRRDVAVLRRWLDLLNAADRVARLGADTWRAPSVSPAEAAARAAASDAFGLRAFALQLRSCTDEELFYHRLAHQGEIGRRGEALRECVEEELLRRPWLIEVPEDASDCDPAVY